MTQMFFGNVRFVVTEIASPVSLCMYIECHGQVPLATVGVRLWCMCLTERVTVPRFSGSLSACIYLYLCTCMCLSELLLGVIASHSGCFSVYIYICVPE